MHPEVRQVGPGNCPICGMALEPEMPTEHADDSELIGVRRKFWIALALTLPVVGDRDDAASARSALVADDGRRAARLGAVAVARPSCSGPRWTTTGAVGSASCNRSPNMYTLIGLGVMRRLRLQHRRDVRAAGVPARNAR